MPGKGKKSFEAALNAPFSDAALGAQIPDLSGYPTDTRHFRQSFTVSTDYNGNLDMVLFPSPVFSIAAKPVGTALGTTSPLVDPIVGGLQLVPSSTVGTTIPGSLFGGSTVAQRSMAVHQVCKTSDLASVFNQFRVVGWGYKIRALGALTTVQGRVQIASIPAPIHLPNVGLMERAAAGGNGAAWTVANAYGCMFGAGSVSRLSDYYNSYNDPTTNTASVGSGTTFGGSLLDYPHNAEVTCVQMANGPLKGHGKLCSRRFEDWREASMLFNSDLMYVDTTSVTAYNAITTASASGSVSVIATGATPTLGSTIDIVVTSTGVSAGIVQNGTYVTSVSSGTIGLSLPIVGATTTSMSLKIFAGSSANDFYLADPAMGPGTTSLTIASATSTASVGPTTLGSSYTFTAATITAQTWAVGMSITNSTTGILYGVVTAVSYPSLTTANITFTAALSALTAASSTVIVGSGGSQQPAASSGLSNGYPAGFTAANDCSGWNAVCVAVIGASVASQAKFEVEVVYHVEGIPTLNLGSSANRTGLGGAVVKHSPLEAMAAEVANGHSSFMFQIGEQIISSGYEAPIDATFAVQQMENYDMFTLAMEEEMDNRDFFGHQHGDNIVSQEAEDVNYILHGGMPGKRKVGAGGYHGHIPYSEQQETYR